jgi:transcriptional regulator with XRE-family HTH domain
MAERDHALRHRSLRAFRLAVGLTQVAAARRAGITQGHWCRLERGQQFASLDLAKALRKLTGVPLSTLMGDTLRVLLLLAGGALI